MPEDMSAGEAWQRRHPRSAVLWAAQLETRDGRRLDCAVLDLSAGGAKLMVQHSLAAGDPVTLSSRRFGARRARVAWVEADRLGLQFLDVIEPVALSQGAGASR